MDRIRERESNPLTHLLLFILIILLILSSSYRFY
jgi:hypothetical protein